MTLVETLFCAVIFTLIVGACTALLLRGWDSWNLSSAQAQMTQDLMQGSAWLTNDLRQASASQITNVPADNNTYGQITFSTVHDVASGGAVNLNPQAINYALSAAGGQQLIRTQNNQARIIATNITALTFSRPAATPNVLNIQLTASVPTYRGSQRLTTTLNVKVLVRNL